MENTVLESVQSKASRQIQEVEASQNEEAVQALGTHSSQREFEKYLNRKGGANITEILGLATGMSAFDSQILNI